MVYKNFLFNFSSSYSGGGLKRLVAFSEWFNNKGGACFIVNSKVEKIMSQYSNNNYFYVDVSRIEKFINNQNYIHDSIIEMRRCDFYYSYNIPIKHNFADINWFHLSNVLPFHNVLSYNIPFGRGVELWWLGRLIKMGLKNANIISAESQFSLNLMGDKGNKKACISPNGSDNEIDFISNPLDINPVKNIAIVIGTYHHKNILDSYKIYRYLRVKNKELKLVIIGDIGTIPLFIKNDPQVDLKGVIGHDAVFALLYRARFYINSSKIENSWNAASEGIFFAEESFISKIPPHCELLQGSIMKVLDCLDTVFHPIIHVYRDNLTKKKLKTWDEVITNMNEYIKNRK